MHRNSLHRAVTAYQLLARLGSMECRVLMDTLLNCEAYVQHILTDGCTIKMNMHVIYVCTCTHSSGLPHALTILEITGFASSRERGNTKLVGCTTSGQGNHQYKQIAADRAGHAAHRHMHPAQQHIHACLPAATPGVATSLMMSPKVLDHPCLVGRHELCNESL